MERDDLRAELSESASFQSVCKRGGPEWAAALFAGARHGISSPVGVNDSESKLVIALDARIPSHAVLEIDRVICQFASVPAGGGAGV